MPRIHSGGKKRSSMQSRKRVGTSGQAASGHGSSITRPDWSRGGSDAASTSGGTSWRKSVSSLSSGSPWAAIASAQPTWPHQSPPVSPGSGIIAVTRTISSTGTRSATNGAVKPPSDWATSTRSSRRSPMASTTASVYSANPAESSSHGRSIATTSWPAARSSAATRSQDDAPSPGPVDAHERRHHPV